MIVKVTDLNNQVGTSTFNNVIDEGNLNTQILNIISVLNNIYKIQDTYYITNPNLNLDAKVNNLALFKLLVNGN